MEEAYSNISAALAQKIIAMVEAAKEILDQQQEQTTPEAAAAYIALLRDFCARDTLARKVQKGFTMLGLQSE